MAKPTISTEHSTGGSSSTTSSHLDDVLEYLPEIDDRSFALPRMNSLKNIVGQQQPAQNDKYNLLQFGSGSFDWAMLAGLTSVPEYAFAGSTQPQSVQANNNGNNLMLPNMVDTKLCKSGLVEAEVQSGNTTQRANLGYLNQSTNVYIQNCDNSTDPFGMGYSSQLSGFGFGLRQ